MKRGCVERRALLAVALSYLVVLVVLFPGLFVGHVLDARAAMYLNPYMDSPVNELELRLYANHLFGDVWIQMTPWEMAQYRTLQTGELPTWNRYIHGGFPTIANQQAAFFYPFHLPYYLVNPTVARGPMAMLRLWVAAFAMHLLLRRFRLSHVAIFIGCVTWMLCSFNVRWLMWRHTNATLWLPVLLLAIDALIVTPGRRRFALAALSATVLFLSGHPHSILLVAMLAGIWTVWRLACLRPAGIATTVRLGLCLLAMIMGIAGAAVTVLPFLCYLPITTEFASGRGGVYARPWFDLWLFIAPNVMGWPRGLFEYHGDVNYNELTYWAGLVSLALAIVGIGWSLRAQRRATRAAKSCRQLAILTLILGTLGAGVAMGLPGVDGIILAISGGRHLGSWSRMICLYQFAVAIGAAVGAHALLQRQPQRGVAVTTASLLLCAAAAISLVLVGNPPSHAAVRQIAALPWGHIFLLPALRTAGTVVISLLAAGVVALIAWRRPRGQAWRLAVAGLVTADLLWIAYGYNPVAPRYIVEPPTPTRKIQPVLDATGEMRVFALDQMLPPNTSMLFGFRDARGYDLPRDIRLDMALGEIDSSRPIFPIMPAQLDAWLDHMSVAFLFSKERIAAIGVDHSDKKWPLAMATPSICAYANPGAAPRAFMPREAVPVPTQTARKMLMYPDLHPVERCGYEVTDISGPLPPEACDGNAHMVDEGDNHVVIRCQSTTGGLVVLTDRMLPGWRVEVDGEPASPLCVSYLFRGVIVPAGMHTIRWTYNAPGFKTGIMLSLLTIIGLILMLAIPPGKTSHSDSIQA